MTAITEPTITVKVAGRQSSIPADALPVVNLRARETADVPTDFLPQAFLRTHRIVPLTVTEEIATLAMVDPLNRALIEEISHETGREIRAVLTTDRDIDWVLRKIYRADNVLTSTQGLVLRQPRNSAHVTFERTQIYGFVALVLGNAVFLSAGIAGALDRKYYKLIPAALVMPLYWLMMSVAAYKALWQLITKPFYWEKTAHGLSNATPHPGFTERSQ